MKLQFNLGYMLLAVILLGIAKIFFYVPWWVVWMPVWFPIFLILFLTLVYMVFGHE